MKRAVLTQPILTPVPQEATVHLDGPSSSGPACAGNCTIRVTSRACRATRRSRCVTGGSRRRTTRSGMSGGRTVTGRSSPTPGRSRSSVSGRTWSDRCGIGRSPRASFARTAALQTEFSRHLFADDGLDPYMEDPATAWLVHWRIAGNATNTTWFWAFSHCPVGTFDRDTLVQGLVKFAGDRGWARAAVSTIRNDVLCFIRTYVPRTPSRRASYEDALESPLTELGLIGQMGRSAGFRLAPGRKPTLGPGVVAYATTTFWNTYSASQTLSFEALAHEPGSPGASFFLMRTRLPSGSSRSRPRAAAPMAGRKRPGSSSSSASAE